MEREIAIEIVRKHYSPDGVDGTLRRALETLIPELAESEDGKIINAIIGILNNSNVIDINVPQERMHAWLEKQKKLFESGRGLYYYDGEKTTFCGYLITEDNPYDFAMSQQEEKQKEHQNNSDAPKEKSVGGNFSSSYKDKNLDDIAQEYVEGVKEYNPTPDWNLIHTAVCYGYHLAEHKEQKPSDLPAGFYFIDKNGKKYYSGTLKCGNLKFIVNQKEQKPAEWSEEDELMRSACIIFVQDEKFKGYERSYECVDWLKSLPERFSLQPKSEWSEEDEKTFWGLTAYIPNEELERLGITRDDILKKLKSISLQPIQLKEAYKEGFQTARHATALAFMKYLDENRPEGKMCLSNGECEEIEKAFLVGDWEKIERYLHKYHWKPSKEQMEALKEDIDFAPDTYKLRCTLVSLYNDLKKL